MNNLLDDNQPKRTVYLKYKYIIILFLIGWLIGSVGFLFKVQSWPMASELVLLTTAINVLSIFLLILKVAFTFDKNSFLNK